MNRRQSIKAAVAGLLGLAAVRPAKTEALDIAAMERAAHPLMAWEDGRDPELVLCDTLTAHPLLSGPEDFCKDGKTISVGPGYIVPRANEAGEYQGWIYVDPPGVVWDSRRRRDFLMPGYPYRLHCAINGMKGTAV